MIFLQLIEQPVQVVIQENKTFIDYIRDPYLWIAFAAVGTSVFTFFKTSRYNRKSLEIAEVNNAANLVVTKELGEKSVEPEITHDSYNVLEVGKPFHSIYTIRNSGVGPAKISTCLFFYMGRSYTNINDLFREQCKVFNGKLNKQHKNMIMYEISKTSIVQGEKIIVYDWQLDLSKDDYLTWMKFLSEITVKVEYASIYDKTKTFEEKLSTIPSGTFGN